MKFSEKWLRTFVDPSLDTRELAHTLTFAGIEVEAIEPAAPSFEQVVVGEVLSVDKHPSADRLSVCRVDAGKASLTIVCGAPNVRAGMKVPTALVGAQLPGLAIKAAKVRGVESQGMLCSEKELGLSAEAAGIMALPADAKVGASVREVLELDDQLLTTKPTPNRGDCLSILGLAREVAASTGATLKTPASASVDAALTDTVSVTLDAPDACPLYCCRLVGGVQADAPTPDWMKRRLERSEVRLAKHIIGGMRRAGLPTGIPLNLARLAQKPDVTPRFDLWHLHREGTAFRASMPPS